MTTTLQRAGLATALVAVLLASACDDTPASPTPPASLTAVTVTPAVVVGGNAVQLTATLSTSAPSTGALIELTSSDGAAMVPPNLVIAAGATSGSVAVPTAEVSQDRSVTVGGSYRGVTQSILLRITP